MGQQINNNGISEQIIEDKIFGKIKMILNNNNYLTRLSRIYIFKTYMITKVNHLLPLISLNGHLSDSWKCIRRIIFRNILKTQTSPLETTVTLGLGYYNLIIRPLLKLIEKYHNFTNNDQQYNFLKLAATKAFTHWKCIEKKLPDEIENEINEIINNGKWTLIDELDTLIYKNIAIRLFRNSNNIKQIKDHKSLKYPNYIYLLSNASTHEILDTIISKEKSKENKNKIIKYERYTLLIKKVYLCNKFLVKLYKDKSTYTLSHNKKLDIIEDVTILELKIVNEAKNITNQDYKEIDEIIEDTEERIKSEIRTSNFGIGDLLTKGKLLDLQTILRTKLCDLEKEQAKTIDLFWEIIEGI